MDVSDFLTNWFIELIKLKWFKISETKPYCVTSQWTYTDFLQILKRMHQDFKKVVKKCPLDETYETSGNGNPKHKKKDTSTNERRERHAIRETTGYLSGKTSVQEIWL